MTREGLLKTTGIGNGGIFTKALMDLESCGFVRKFQFPGKVDRADGIVNLCEMKYSNKPFVISEQYRLSVLDKVDAWRRAFGSKKAIHVTFVTAEGLKPNDNSDIVQSEVRLADLFA